MCLAVPGKVEKLNSSKNEATISYFDGSERTASTIALVPKTGDYVLVQAGLVIQVVPEAEALESIEAWKLLQQTETH